LLFASTLFIALFTANQIALQKKTKKCAQVATEVRMFGGDLCETIRRRLGTETTWLDLERPSRLHGGDSQVNA